LDGVHNEIVHNQSRTGVFEDRTTLIGCL